RREAQLFVSKELHCPGFLIFVYDGIYWGYEFFDDGQVQDHFVQDMDEGRWHFPDDPCVGNAQLLADHFDWLTADDVEPYLVQDVDFSGFAGKKEILEFMHNEFPKLNISPRPGDEYT